MMIISTPTTVVVNPINPIRIQFRTLDFELMIEDENNMVPVASCQQNPDESPHDTFTDEMISNLDMFTPIMKHEILAKGDS
jgi:hypothetical protein